MSKKSVDHRRVRALSSKPVGAGPVVYWMSRDQRVEDNWALLYAQELALQRRQLLVAVFCLVPEFLGASRRQYLFMLQGLETVALSLRTKNILFILVRGDPSREIPRCVRQYKAGVVVTDFDPLRIKAGWKKSAASQIDVPLYEVDAHNIVPCWYASDHQEYGAYTIRPKIKRALPDFLCAFPQVARHPYTSSEISAPVSWNSLTRGLGVPARGGESKAVAGSAAAKSVLTGFIRVRSKRYVQQRNDPLYDAQSGLSPYLHFGQIAAQRVAWEVKKSAMSPLAKASFLEELIVRRELSDNFCFYNPGYDSVGSFPEWARKTLSAHAKDRRPYRYSLDHLEKARTHDPLWNAAQQQMVREGKMHGFLRMYWAKKILEWTPDAAEALRVAIYLNDAYSLDGRDPNGYTGIAWSIGGVHDRAWGERAVFGKIRYMSYNGCRTKFDVEAFVKRYA